MRCLLLVVALAACGSHGSSTGPTWPKLHDAEADGGESIAPRESKQLAVALEKTEEEAKPAPAEPEAKPAAAPATPEVAAPAAAQSPVVEESITTEDIIIEVDD